MIDAGDIEHIHTTMPELTKAGGPGFRPTQEREPGGRWVKVEPEGDTDEARARAIGRLVEHLADRVTPAVTHGNDKVFEQTYRHAYAAGLHSANPDHRWNALDERWISGFVDFQKEHLAAFRAQLDDMTDAQIDARAQLYLDPIWAAFNQGRLTAEIEGGAEAWTWRTSLDENVCDLCDPREGVVYNAETLPGVPGTGNFGELCEGRCRCWLDAEAAT